MNNAIFFYEPHIPHGHLGGLGNIQFPKDMPETPWKCPWLYRMMFPNLKTSNDMTKDVSKAFGHFQWRFGHVFGIFWVTQVPVRDLWHVGKYRLVCLDVPLRKNRDREFTINGFGIFVSDSNLIRLHMENVKYHIPFRIQQAFCRISGSVGL